jgi:hypothetical protein
MEGDGSVGISNRMKMSGTGERALHAILYTCEAISRRQESPDMNRNDAMNRCCAVVVAAENIV